MPGDSVLPRLHTHQGCGSPGRTPGQKEKSLGSCRPLIAITYVAVNGMEFAVQTFFFLPSPMPMYASLAIFIK